MQFVVYRQVGIAHLIQAVTSDGKKWFQVEKLAGATGLEPAASCVTGRRSNQLNYAPALKNPIPCNYCVCLSVPVDSKNFLKMP